MKVLLKSDGKTVLFKDGALTGTINVNDDMWQTLDVETETPLIDGRESLWVVFQLQNDPLFITNELLLARDENDGHHRILIPDGVIAVPGTWTFQLFIRTYDNISEKWVKRVGANIDTCTFTVENGLPVSGDEKVTNSTIASLYNTAMEKIAIESENANGILALQEDVAELKESGSENAIPVTEKGQPNGVATLGADGKVPAEQLPEMGGGGETPDLSEYVKFTDYATPSKAGVVKFSITQGIGVNNDGTPFIFYATQDEIDKKASYRYPIVPTMLDYAVKVGVCTNTITLTDDEKASACDWLGAVKVEENTTSVPFVYTDDKTFKHYLAQIDSEYKVRNIPMIYGSTAGKNKPSNGYLITNDPVNPYHCANQRYVDNAVVKLYKHILNTSFGEITLVSYSPEVKTMQQPNSGYDPEYPDEQPEHFDLFVIPQYIFGYCGISRVVAIDYAIDDIYIALISSTGYLQDTEIKIYSYNVEEYNGGDI